MDDLKKVPSKNDSGGSPVEAKPAQPVEREQDAIYQKNRLVARILDPELDLEAKEVRFGEIYQCDELLLPDECEFQKHRILVRRVADATKIDRAAPHKGRILRGVAAELLGYREQ